MTSLVKFILWILSILGLYTKGRVDQSKSRKIKDLESEVRAHEIENEVEGLPDKSRRDELANWVRDE